MEMGARIKKLRAKAGLTQEELSQKLNVSHQAVQKWESGKSNPDLDSLTALTKIFGVSADYLLFEVDNRQAEELAKKEKYIPSYDLLEGWELYSRELETEYRQCVEEGLDVEPYSDLFKNIAAMEQGVGKEKMADALFDIVSSLPIKEGYAYDEPSTLEEIRETAGECCLPKLALSDDELHNKIKGAWYGRIIGCLLGKPVEGIKHEELEKLLKLSGNYPMERYILSSDITNEILDTFQYNLEGHCFADTVDCAPVDDDTNYVALYQLIVERYGRDFTPYDVARAWMNCQPKTAYCTAERVAFRNFVNGYFPPASALYKNPYREWIGAQIRGDYFGYINPGDPITASDMAWRDASISHVKNGIYGEMFAAAMISAAAVTDDIEQIIRCGISVIPQKSRLCEAVERIIDCYNSGMSVEDCMAGIHTRWDDHNSHDWCHTISNAEIVTAALLYGKGGFAKSICLAVQTAFDTDCNGATVGSVLGMRNGFTAIPDEWTAPINGTLDTSIIGVGKVKLDNLVEKTFEHMAK